MVSLIRYLVPSGKEDGTARELREDDEDEDVFGQVVGQVVDAVIRNGCVEAWVMRSSPLERWRQKMYSRQMQRAKAAGWPTEELLKVGINQALAMRLDAANSKVTDSGPEERHSPRAGDLDLDLDLGFPNTPNKTPHEPRSDVLKWLEREELMNELTNDEDWAQTPGKTPGSSPRGERPPRKTDFLSPVRPYAAARPPAPDADERVAAAPANAVRLPERFEELQLFSSTADASLLSAPADAGLYSKLESGGAFNIAEKVLPLANDLKRLSTARYFFSLRARIVPHVTL